MSTHDEPTTKLTYSDYALFPNDGMRHEIIHGRHHMNAAPSPRHQTVSRRMQFQLYQQIELPGFGQVFDAPIDLQLSETDVVQPDIVIVLRQNPIITTTKIKGIPDLVIEILSPTNREYDQTLKKRLYEQHRIPEYWIVDPEDQIVEQNVLDEGKYRFAIRELTIEWATLSATIDLKAVWAQ